MGLLGKTVSYNRGDTGADEASAFVSALAQRESSGNYNAKGIIIRNPKSMYYGDRAYGKYQVMGKNIPAWTKQYLGKSLSIQDFLADPAAQDNLMKARANELYRKYGSWADVASVHFTGRPLEQARTAKDGNGTVNEDYVNDILRNMSGHLAVTPARGAPFNEASPLHSQFNSEQQSRDFIESLALAIPRGFARFALSTAEAPFRIASAIGEITGKTSGDISHAVVPPAKIPGLGFLGPIQSYESAANAGEAGLGRTAFNVATDEPVGVAFKPLAFGAGFLAKFAKNTMAEEAAKKVAEAAAEYDPQFKQGVQNVAESLGLPFEHGPVKDPNRIAEKARTDYGGDISQMSDLNRSVVFVDSFDKLHGTLEKVQQQVMKEFGNVSRVKFTVGDPTYNKVIVNTKLPYGGTGEIQITTPAMWSIKQGAGDTLYGIARAEATPKKIADALNERISELYTFDPNSAFTKAAAASNEGGFTTDVLRNIDYSGTPNISVAPFPERTMKFQGPTSPKQLAEFLKKNMDILSKEGYSVGGWYNAADGSTYLDVALPVPKQFQAEAEQLGKMSNQIAAFDLENFKEIPLGGTGAADNVAPLAERMKFADEIIAKSKPASRDLVPPAQAGKTVPSSIEKAPKASQTPPKLPEPASYKDDIGKLANEKMNVENFNISDAGKEIIQRVVDEVKPAIQEAIGRTLTNKETLKLADQASKTLRRTVGRDKTLEWQAAMLNARRALAKASADGRVDRDYIDALLTVKTQGTDIARRLQSLSIGADPVEVTSKQAILEAVLKATNDAEAIANAAKGVDFNNLKQATDFYRKFIKPTASDWLDLIRYNSMLSSPRTHIINAFSNLLNTVMVAPIEKAIAGGLDFLGSKISGKARQAFAGEGGAYAFNYFKNLREATFRFADVIRGKRASTNLDTKMIPIAASGAKGKLVSTLAFPMRVLEATDQFFTALAEGAETGALKYRQSKGVKVGNIESKAQESAAYRLFRQELFNDGQGHVLDAIDQLTSKIQGLRNNKNPIVANMFRFTVPFIRTPMNILKQGVEYSPAGFTTIPGAANKTEQLSKAILGTAVFASAYTMLASNRLTWGEPTDPKLKQTFRAAGMQPYSVKIGNTWYSFQKLPPAMAFPMAMVASINDLMENRKTDDNTVDLVLSGIAKYGQFFADQSYVKSFGDLLAAAKGGEAGVERIVSNYTQQLVPFRALGGWLARLTDAVQRKPDSAASFVDQQVQLLMMNIPGLSQKTPARLDADGNPIPNQRRAANAFSPIQTSVENNKSQDFKDLVDLKKINKKTSEASAAKKDMAQTEFDNISALPSAEEKKAYLKGIAAKDPELAKKIIALAKEKSLDRTGLEESIQNAPVATRVQFIMKKLDELSTPEEKKALIKEYAAKKIVTKDVLIELAKALKEQP